MSNFLFVSRRSITTVPFLVYGADGELVDADTEPTVSMKSYVDDSLVVPARDTAKKPDATGVYETTLSSVETSTPGLFYLEFLYDIGGASQEWRTDVEIPNTTASHYEALGDNDRAIVEQTWMRFSDMFDSATGGPNLGEYAQSSFGRERLAQLLKIALNRVNTSSQPPQTFSLDEGDFPHGQWGGVLEHALYIEAIRHLIRSYSEQPSPQGLQTVRLDRSNYAQFWRSILQDELPAFEEALDNFKISSLRLGRASVLVAGGVYGEWSRPIPPTRPRHRMPIGW